MSSSVSYMVWASTVGDRMRAAVEIVEHTRTHRDTIANDHIFTVDVGQRISTTTRQSHVDTATFDHLLCTNI